MDVSEIVQDPSFPDSANATALQRVCQGCYEEVSAAIPNGLSVSRMNSMERIVIDQGRLSIPSTSNVETSSQISDLAE